MLILHPFQQFIFKSAESKEKMLCIFQNRFVSTNLAFWIYQILWIKELSTLIALISACMLISAIRTCSLYISIRKKPFTVFTVKCFRLFLINKALLVEFSHNIFNNILMKISGCSREKIKGDSELLHILLMLFMKSIRYLLR